MKSFHIIDYVQSCSRVGFYKTNRIPLHSIIARILGERIQFRQKFPINTSTVRYRVSRATLEFRVEAVRVFVCEEDRYATERMKETVESRSYVSDSTLHEYSISRAVILQAAYSLSKLSRRSTPSSITVRERNFFFSRFYREIRLYLSPPLLLIAYLLFLYFLFLLFALLSITY